MTTTFQRELVTDIRREVQPLLELHWDEIAVDKDIPLNVDWASYTAGKAVRVYTARDDGALVGYACFVLNHNKHYMDSLQAMQDVLFVHREHRRGLMGYRFIRFCDDQLRAEGVQKVMHHVKKAHNFGPVLERQGYEEIEIIYAKRLDKG